jgi:MFS family permease
MASQLTSITAILLSTAFFLMGNGLIGTLTPYRAHLEGFSDIQVGALGALYFAGFVGGCFAGPNLVARVGHIRLFAVAAVVEASTVLAMALAPSPLAWFALRAAMGVCMAGLFLAVESWLHDRATNETRGRLFAAYISVNLVALLAGQWLLTAAPAQGFQLFSAGALLFCLCVVPIGLTRLPPPAPRAAPRLAIDRIFRLSPVGAAGCLAVGLANGAFWTLAPIYALSLGFSTHDLALFMSAFIAGGAVVQWPLGRASDVIDRRGIIAVSCTGASVCGLVLGLLGWLLVGVPGVFYLVVFLLGATMLPLYSLSVAHANDRLPRDEFVEVSAGLLMINAATSVVGPLLASFMIATAGPYSLFLFTALVHAAMAFYAFTRMQMREPVPPEERSTFAPAPPGSPASIALDPRGPEELGP